MIMSCVDGEAAPRRILHDAEFDSIRPRLAYEMGTVLARIHAADADRVPGLPDGSDQLDALYREYLESGTPLPVMEIAFRRLRENQRPPTRTTLVHGDFRLGNLLVSPSGITGVLDWELTHRGDPAQDLGWLCTRAWRFGSAGRVGGIGDLGDLLRGYTDEKRHHRRRRVCRLVAALRFAALGHHLPPAGRARRVRPRRAGAPGRRATGSRVRVRPARRARATDARFPAPGRRRRSRSVR